ncbi:MAG: DUF5926 family protein [Bifidobacteriaceae bacterium]|jgi:hypothetical protein|nr:DUF5926 family protein [Bifidobacteriaceae bacterium]
MAKNPSQFQARPLEGVPLEAELVAMREILQTAEAWATLADGGDKAQFVTALPDLARCWRRADGVPAVALQPAVGTDDLSRELGNALVAALAAEPGEVGEPVPLGADGPRLQELLDPAGETDFQLRDSLAFWADLDPEDDALKEAAKESEGKAEPVGLVPGQRGAYWTRLGEREYLRWSLGLEEDTLMDALARLQAQRDAGVMPGARYAGAFRALGLVIPVWSLPAGTQAADLAEPAAAFKERLDQALADPAPLDAAQRRSRAGLVARMLSLR